MVKAVIGLIITFFIQAAGVCGTPEEPKSEDNLKAYYTQEKAHWDKYIENNCPKDVKSKKCETARGMQNTYFTLLTDLLKDKTHQWSEQSARRRAIYEVPEGTSPQNEEAAFAEPQTAAEDIP